MKSNTFAFPRSRSFPDLRGWRISMFTIMCVRVESELKSSALHPILAGDASYGPYNPL
jgi:hypothetical protein